MGALKIRDASNLRVATAIKVRDAGSVLRTLQQVRVRDGDNVLRAIWSALTASASPNTATGYAYSGGDARDVMTTFVTASPNGGTAPFTYAWARTDGGGGSWSITNASGATTAFICEGLAADGSLEAEFRCTVTDANGSSAQTSPVAAAAYNVISGWDPFL